MVEDSSERRRYPRQAVSMQVRYRSLDTFFYDYAMNISRGGIFIKTQQPLARGSDVEIEFEIPESPKKFHASGKVARVIFPGDDSDEEPAGMGIEFGSLSEEDMTIINLLWHISAGEKD